MRRINNAPETMTDQDLHYQYSRSERVELSGFTNGRSQRPRRYGLSKILLFDLLFLFVIGGIILPFLIERNMKDRVDSLTFTMELRRDQQDILVSLHISNRVEGSLPDQTVFIELFAADISVASWEEIPPAKDAPRTLRYRIPDSPEKTPVVISVQWGDKKGSLNGRI